MGCPIVLNTELTSQCGLEWILLYLAVCPEKRAAVGKYLLNMCYFLCAAAVWSFKDSDPAKGQHLRLNKSFEIGSEKNLFPYSGEAADISLTMARKQELGRRDLLMTCSSLMDECTVWSNVGAQPHGFGVGC